MTVRYFQRYGAVNLIGDIEIMDKLSQAQSWVSDEMRNEFYANGFLGKYKGANAIQMMNGYEKDAKTLVVDKKLLFLVPAGQEMPLKIVLKGDILSMEAQDIDTAYFDLVLRQRFGAALVYGNAPMLGVYQDSST